MWTSPSPRQLACNDFYWNDPDGSYDKPMGHIQLLEYMSGQTLEGQVGDWLPPGLVPDVISEGIAERMLSMLVISEDLPLPEKPGPSDQRRAHLRRLHLQQPGGARAAGEEAARLAGWLRRPRPPDQPAPLRVREALLPLYGTAHQAGTVRFGTEPKSSVLDIWCKAHELDNLYVTDTSFFPSIASVNPTLTTVANALRVGGPSAGAAGQVEGRARQGRPAWRGRGRTRPERAWPREAPMRLAILSGAIAVLVLQGPRGGGRPTRRRPSAADRAR